jgi:hypothetical protein
MAGATGSIPVAPTIRLIGRSPKRLLAAATSTNLMRPLSRLIENATCQSQQVLCRVGIAGPIGILRQRDQTIGQDQFTYGRFMGASDMFPIIMGFPKPVCIF